MRMLRSPLRTPVPALMPVSFFSSFISSRFCLRLSFPLLLWQECRMSLCLFFTILQIFFSSSSLYSYHTRGFLFFQSPIPVQIFKISSFSSLFFVINIQIRFFCQFCVPVCCFSHRHFPIFSRRHPGVFLKQPDKCIGVDTADCRSDF